MSICSIGRRCLQARNKWWRRFGSEDNALWKRLICSIYKVERGRWFPSYRANSSFSRIWSGDGNRIRFWIDKWLGKTAQANGIYALEDLALVGSIRGWSEFMDCSVQLHRLELVLLITLDGLPHPQVALMLSGLGSS
ncbi:unnamed protein product [Camellia sinensis]